MMEKDNNNINSLYFSFKGHIKIKNIFLKELKRFTEKTTKILKKYFSAKFLNFVLVFLLFLSSSSQQKSHLFLQ